MTSPVEPIEAVAGAPQPAAASAPVIHTIATVGLIQVLSMAFTLLRSKVVALTLGTTGVGAIGLIDQVATLIAQISTFSLPVAAVKFLSAAHSESRDAFARLYSAFLRVLLVLSLIGTAIGVALLLGRPEVLGRELTPYSSLAILALLALPATNVSTLVTNTLAAARR